MIKCVFTLDYEIYGNGAGSLREVVLKPTQLLAGLFRDFGAKFVVFAEAIELAKMQEAQSDPDIAEVGAQLCELRRAGHEIALHVHPWWANAQFANGRWRLDWNEYNICTLPPDRVDTIITAAISYLRTVLDDPQFVASSFRSGLWALQPTSVIANVLARHGIQIDSSLYKGGRVRSLGLDYRPALKNGAFWRFTQDVNVPDVRGRLLEIPIHTELVPFWRMLGRKRIKVHKKAHNSASHSSNESVPLSGRWRDFLRLRYPRKLDFCRMTFEEMRGVIQSLLEAERNGTARPDIVVAIGHSKDFVDSDAVRRFLEFLKEQSVVVTTFSALTL